MDRLLTLVSSGTIDGVSLGSTIADVRARLGDPEATARRIWKYGALQIGFHESRVTLLLLTAEGADDPPWDPTTDLGSMQALLTAEGIVYEVDAAHLGDADNAARPQLTRAPQLRSGTRRSSRQGNGRRIARGNG
jgi:hypothetical protein